MENDVFVVIKTLYAMDCSLVDDFGNHVNCLSELVGVFAKETDAREAQESILNSPDTNILPWAVFEGALRVVDEELAPHTIYVDVTVTSTEMR